MTINTVVYGGSFSPFHLGHLFTVCYLASTGEFDNIIVIPVAKHAYSKDLIDYHHRFEMCRLGTKNIQNVQVLDVDRTILDNPNYPNTNYSYYTIKYLKELHPDWDINLAVGSDLVKDINKWKLGNELLLECNLRILGRHGFESDGLAIFPDISSTQIRESLKSDHRIAKTFLTKPIYNYIVNNNLYSG